MFTYSWLRMDCPFFFTACLTGCGSGWIFFAVFLLVGYPSLLIVAQRMVFRFHYVGIDGGGGLCFRDDSCTLLKPKISVMERGCYVIHSNQGQRPEIKEPFAVGVPKDLNNPNVYAEALVRAVLIPQREALAAWLADEANSEQDGVTEYPFRQWYLFFADRIMDMMPRPELGFQFRPKRTVAVPKIGRNDLCPCGSRKKYKQCHLVTDDGQEVTGWKLGSPTSEIRAMSVSSLVHQLPLAILDQVPRAMAPPVALAEMAAVYQENGRLEDALQLMRTVLDGDREDPFLLFDYLIARYAEWLVEAGREIEGEQFLMDEYDNPRQVEAWQVAQKLAAFYLDQSDFANAEIWVSTALDGDAENPFNYYLKGLLAHFDEAWEDAIAAYEQASQFSDRFREEEKDFMSTLIDDALNRAENQQPVDDDEEEGEDNTASAVDGEDKGQEAPQGDKA